MTTSTIEVNHLINEIERYRPDVIIIDDREAHTGAIKFCELFTNYPRLRVLVVGIEENLVQVYEKREITVTKATDLVQEIRVAYWHNIGVERIGAAKIIMEQIPFHPNTIEKIIINYGMVTLETIPGLSKADIRGCQKGGACLMEIFGR